MLQKIEHQKRSSKGSVPSRRCHMGFYVSWEFGRCDVTDSSYQLPNFTLE